MYFLFLDEDDFVISINSNPYDERFGVVNIPNYEEKGVFFEGVLPELDNEVGIWKRLKYDSVTQTIVVVNEQIELTSEEKKDLKIDQLENKLELQEQALAELTMYISMLGV